MKHAWIVFLCFLLLAFSACEMEDVPYDGTAGIDYRDSFCGEFVFVSQSWTWILATGYEINDTVTYWGFVSKVDTNMNLLRIRYRPGDPLYHCGPSSPWRTFLLPSVALDGTLHYSPWMNCTSHGNFDGRFIGEDSIFFDMGNGGLGMQSGHRVEGKRVE